MLATRLLWTRGAAATSVVRRLATAASRPLARSSVQSCRCSIAPLPRPEPLRRLLHTSNTRYGVVPFLLADIGEGIAEAEVIQWFVEEGDVVKQFDKICEVESDKATVGITSRFDGTVVKRYHDVGGMAAVGQPLVDIEVEGEPDAVPAAPEAEKIEVPPDAICAISTDAAAAAQDVGQRTSSTPTPLPAAMTPQSSVAPPPPRAATNPSSASSLRGVRMAPAARKLVLDNGLDVSLITPSGGHKGDVYTKSDIVNYMQSVSDTEASSAPLQAATSHASPSPAQPQKDEIVPITGLKRSMVKSMTEALKVPHFGYADEIELNALIAVRADFKKMLAAEGSDVRITYMPFFIKAASLALMQFPLLNSHVNGDCTELIMRGSHNIGVAMQTPRGLLVPNIKDVQGKSILEVAEEMTRLQQLGSNNQLGGSDLSGGTFTLSNIGNVGGTYTSPVVVVPEVAIGALGSIKRVPRFDEQDQVYPANIINVSWSADHRVVDGVTMAQFSNLWKSMLEQPTRMLARLK